MPLYNVRCEKCGDSESLCRGEAIVCNECGGPAEKLDSISFRPVGIIFSNVESSSQLGQTFTSESAKRKYLRDNGIGEIIPGSQEDLAMRDRIEEGAQKFAQTKGYSDIRAYRAARKAEPRPARRR